MLGSFFSAPSVFAKVTLLKFEARLYYITEKVFIAIQSNEYIKHTLKIFNHIYSALAQVLFIYKYI